MIKEPIIEHAQSLLEFFSKKFPAPGRIWDIIADKRDDKNLLIVHQQAVDFLKQQEFIVPSSTKSFFVLSSSGMKVLESGGVRVFVQAQFEKDERANTIDKLTFKKLQENLKAVQRQNVYWRWAAAAGAASFIMQIIEFFSKL